MTYLKNRILCALGFHDFYWHGSYCVRRHGRIGAGHALCGKLPKS